MLSLPKAKQILNGRDNWRGDCLDCGGKNTLSISNVGGEIKWFCFQSNCKTKGRRYVRRTIDEIIKSMRGKDRELINIPFEVPTYFIDMNSTPRSTRFFNFLTTIGMDDKVECRYDPRQNRAVFLIKRGLYVVDAIGKSLNKTLPKWFRYGHSGQSFMLNDGDTCVVVEDIPSAITVGAAGYASIALLGTHLTTLDIKDLMGYNNIIVALDPDAHSKGVAIAARLDAYSNARAILIPNDLKYFKPNEVREILCNTE
jgi:hypothetical protein